MRKIVLDPILCDGNGLCVKEAPAHFALDSDDVLQILKATCDEGEAPPLSVP